MEAVGRGGDGGDESQGHTHTSIGGKGYLTISSDNETEQKLVQLEEIVSELVKKKSRSDVDFRVHVVGVMVVVVFLIGMMLMLLV